MKKLFIVLIATLGVLAVGCTDKNDDTPQNPNEQPGEGNEEGGGNETPEPVEPIFQYNGKGEYLVAADGAVVVVKLTTNIEYEISIPAEAAHWIGYKREVLSQNNETLRFTITKNTAYTQRSAIVTLKTAEQEVLQSIKFVQEAAEDPNVIKFADATVKEICLSLCDTNKDGNLTYDEAATLTDLGDKFKGSDITSFDELKHFVGITSIADSTFEGCQKLTTLSIPEGVTVIGNKALCNCVSLKNVLLPATLTAIGDEAFYGCANIAELTIRENITTFGNRVFTGCGGSLVLNSNTPDASYSYGVFFGSSFTKITIGNGVTAIGSSTFEGSKYLTTVTMAESVTTLGKYAFRDCTALANLSLSDKLATIETACFEGCTTLAEVVVPEGITTLAANTFKNCRALTTVTLPESLTTIDEGTFDGCISIKTISIPKKVTSIGDYALRDCSALTTLTIQEGLTQIGAYTFSKCVSLKRVDLPKSLKSIGERGFHGCEGLESLYCKPTTPPTLGDKALQYYDNRSLVIKNIGCKIYVPTSSVSTYKSNSGWKTYANDITGYSF